jgi:D-alanyl-D-alanine carboxypeptidase
MMSGWSRIGTFALATAICSAVAWGQAEPPTLNGLGAIVMDAESGRILYSKNADLRLHPASTTKIMTALLLAEKCRPEEMITAPEDVKTVKESSMHLEPGEWLSAEEMMYALLLRSANDGCHSVAVHIAGSEAAFADLMNKRAKEIGCTNTTFVNPHGLTDPNHLTTPHDLALIAREAMKNPLFAKVAGTQKHVLVRSLNLKDTLVENHDKWLWLDPRAKGVKTGWTKPAGHCFVGCATENGATIITVVMKSEAWIHDQQAMVNWAFSNFEIKTLFKKGDDMDEVTVVNGSQPKVRLVCAKDVSGLVAKERQKAALTWDRKMTVTAPVLAGQPVVTAYWDEGNGPFEVPLVAAASVPKATLASTIASPGGVLGFGVLAGGAMVMRVRSRRMAKKDWQ